MKVNKVGAKVIIPTIIIFKDFFGFILRVSFHWWCYEIVLFGRKLK